MTRPFDPTQLAAVRDFPTWRAAIERALTRLDDRLVQRGSSARPAARIGTFSTVPAAPPTSPGEAVLWLGGDLPGSLLPCDGTTRRADWYPDLAAALGDRYTDGEETEGEFRLPMLDPPQVGVYAVRT